jgi:hypothetical protein
MPLPGRIRIFACGASAMAVDLAHPHHALRVDRHRVQLDARRDRRRRAEQPVGALPVFSSIAK